MNEDLRSNAFLEPVSAPEPEPHCDRKFPVWSGWDVLLLFFFTFFAGVLLAASSRAVAHFLRVQFPSMSLLRHPVAEGVGLVLFHAVLDLLIFLFIYFTVKLKYNSPFLTSIRWVNWRRSWAVIYPSIGILLALTAFVLSAVFPVEEKPPIERLLKFPMTAILFAALGVFVAPFVEEVTFRGFIYPVLERRLKTVFAGLLRRVRAGTNPDRINGQGAGKILAVLLTGLLFGALHLSQLWGSWMGVSLILGVGITLSAARATTNSLIPSFIIHLSYNTTLCLISFFGSAFEGFPA